MVDFILFKITRMPHGMKRPLKMDKVLKVRQNDKSTLNL
jgi:hypothetical protein